MTETVSKLIGYSFTGPDINVQDASKLIGYNYSGTINNADKSAKLLGYMLLSTLPIATPKASTSVRIGAIKGILVP
jgi:hypothetical protein